MGDEREQKEFPDHVAQALGAYLMMVLQMPSRVMAKIGYEELATYRLEDLDASVKAPLQGAMNFIHYIPDAEVTDWVQMIPGDNDYFRLDVAQLLNDGAPETIVPACAIHGRVLFDGLTFAEAQHSRAQGARGMA